MAYYTDERLPFYVNGRLMHMTEDEAEDFQDNNPDVDVQSAIEIEPLTLRVDDDIIECTCNDEYDICPACAKYFEEFADD